MKMIRCVFVVFLLLALQAVAHAQTDSLFYFSTVKVKGMYRTFEEFKKNAPSISLNGVVIEYEAEENMYQKDLPVARLNCDSVLPCEKKTPIWGFCDGKAVYISREKTFDVDVTYDKVKYIGRYMYYQYLHQSTVSASNTGPGSSTGGYVMGGGRSQTVIDRAIDINTGKTFELSNQKIVKILKTDRPLTTAFNKEKHKERVQATYLIKYAEKHKEEIVK